MKREHELARRLHSLRALGEAVGAMKNVSAHHFREARREVDPARRYRAGIEHVLALAGSVSPSQGGATGLVVIGGERGLSGAYNAQVVEAAVKSRAELGAGPTFCVGRRAATLLGRRGLPIARAFSAPTSVRGLADSTLHLAEEVLTAFAGEGLASFHVVSSHFAGAGVVQPEVERLLPLGSRSERSGPAVRYTSPEHLAIAAGRELLFVAIYARLVDSLASEHAARLAATQAAEKWLDERLEHLERRLASARREASTQEMIEIATGRRGARHGSP